MKLRHLKVKNACERCRVSDLIRCGEDDFIFEWTYGVIRPEDEIEAIPSWFVVEKNIPIWYVYGRRMPVQVSVRQWMYVKRSLRIFLSRMARPGLKIIDDGDVTWLGILYEASGLDLYDWSNIVEEARKTLFYLLEVE